MADRNQLVTGLIAGAVVGAVAGLLLAPKTGKEAREIVVARAGEARQKAGQYATSLRERIRRGQSDEESSDEQRTSVPPAVGDRFLILTVRRGKRVVPMSLSFKPQEGDLALVAIHVPDREEAHRLLTEMGWEEPKEAEED